MHEEALNIYRQLGDNSGVATVLMNLGDDARYRGDYKGAEGFYRESLGIFRVLGTETGIMIAAGNLGFVAHHLGNLQEAKQAFLEALTLAQEVSSSFGVAVVLTGIAGVILSEVGVEAPDTHEAGSGAKLDLAAEFSVLPFQSSVLKQATRLLGFVAGLLEQIGAGFEALEQAEFDRNMSTARARLSEEAFTAAWEEGKALTLEEAVTLAQQPLTATLQTFPQAPRTIRPPETPAMSDLTAREAEVLRLVAVGLSNPEIAEHLSLSVFTVQAHLRSIFSKINVKTRAAAVHFVFEHSLS
jgi:DNA-binding CsgD family transcriptional regulator/tetratricopeptide (TPR) repeat protein